MIDKNKRKTLKALSVSAGMLAAGTGGAAAAFGEPVNDVGNMPVISDAQIQVTTRVSALSNDLEVVLTNASKQPVVITQIAPQSTQVTRGEFNFSELFSDGAVSLKGGESVSVPLRHKPVSLVATDQYSSLTESLRKSMTIVTQGDLVAKLSVAEFASFA